MFTIALYQPEIPQNTGNAMRLAVNVGAALALIEPLGFELTDARVRRAGLDYRHLATTTVYPSLEAFLAELGARRLFAFSTRAARRYDDAAFVADDVLLFGPESSGLPEEVLESIAPQRRLRIPMRPNSRSINLANAVAIAVYEAWRQFGFRNALGGPFG